MTLSPSVLTNVHPDDILIHDKRLVTRHFKASFQCESKESFDKAMGSFSTTDRATIAEILRQLRFHGYHPLKLDSNGQIVWARRMS